MHFAWTSLFDLAPPRLSSAAAMSDGPANNKPLSGTAATSNGPTDSKPTLRDKYHGGRVLNATTFQTGGHQITVSTKACPGHSSRAAMEVLPLTPRPGDIQKRPTLDVPCTVSCGSLGGVPPALSDCQTPAFVLSQAAGEFTCPPQSTTFGSGSCAIAFINLAPDPLLTCFTALGNLIATLVSRCFPVDGLAFGTGVSLPTQLAGQESSFEAFLNS